METLIKKLNNLSLRKYFVVSVLATLVIIVLLSLFTIWGCMSFRKYLLPDSNNVFLKVYRTYEDGSEVSYSVRVKVGEEGAELPVITADDKAAKKDPDASYGYLINKLGARILQTDSPAFMLNYLRSKGWHD